jgi:hypothetical protein
MVPNVIGIPVYLDVMDEYKFQIEVVGVETNKFLLSVAVNENTIIKNFGIQYIAFVNDLNFPLFQAGTLQLSDDTELAIGTGARSHQETIVFSNKYPDFYGNLKGITFI